MKIINELLNYTDWKYPDVYGFTSNSVVKSNGELVMGAGAALALKKAHPNVPKLIGKALNHKKTVCDFIQIKEGLIVFWFQTKNHYNEPSNIKLISKATERLKKVAEDNPNIVFHLNAPGIGLGGLKWEDVLPIIEILPDNVRIYK